MTRATKTQKSTLALLDDAIAEADRFIQSELEELTADTKVRRSNVLDIGAELTQPRGENTGQEAIREAKRELVKAQARADLGEPSNVEAAKQAVAEAEANTVDQQVRHEALLEVKDERRTALDTSCTALAEELTEPLHSVREAAHALAQEAADNFHVASSILAKIDLSGRARVIELPFSEAERAYEFPPAVDRVVITVQSARRTLARD